MPIKTKIVSREHILPKAVSPDKMDVEYLSAIVADLGSVIVGDADGIHIQIDGFNTRMRSSDFVSGALGSGWKIDGNLAEFNNIRARGKISTSVFEKDAISVIGGNVLIMGGDILNADMTAADNSTMTIFGDTTFAVNDILRIKDGVSDEWFKVTAIDGNVYTVERDKDNQYGENANPIWKKGTAVVNYGANGEGGIYLTSSEANAPYISIVTHTGSPWSTLTTRARLGNLNGFLGYSSDLYGIAIGETDAYLKYDPTNGLRIKGTIICESGSTGFTITFAQATIPTSLNIGDLWIDTDDGNKLYRAESAGADQITAGEWVDVQDDAIATAQAAADAAQADATTAIADAAAAQTDATSNIALLADIASDAKITPIEKLTIKPLWDAVVAEKSDIDTQADTYSVSKTAYGTAYTNLNNYLNTTLTVFNDMTATTSITRATWDGYWEAYYNAKIEILNAIANAIQTNAAAAQTSADAAQADATTAITNAATAQAAADAAQADATTGIANAATAQGELDDIAADTKITPVEKLTIKPIWDDIVVEGTATTGTIPVQATAFSVSDADFDTAFAALNLYLNTTVDVFTNMAATSTIVRATWDTNWKNYYDERTKLLNAIATAAKTLADAAQSTADSKTDDTVANTKAKVFRQSSVPTSVSIGDLWIDTDDNKLYRATNVGDDQITAGEWELQNAAIATGWSHASDQTKIDGGDIYANSIVLVGLASETTDRMFDTSTKSDNIQAWIHASDVTLIDGGKIYTNSIIVAGLNSAVTDRMFTDGATADNIEAWRHASDVTKIDGGDIYTDTVTAIQISVSQLDAINTNTGSLNIDEYIKSGQTAYDTGTGFWMEYNSGTPRFSIGNSSANKLIWDGSALAVKGAITATSGDFTGSITIGSDSRVFIDGTNTAIKVFGATITIETDTNDDLDWTEDSVTKAAIITASTTYTPTTLAAEVQTKMRAAGDSNTTVTYNSTTKKITIANGTLTTLTLLFYSGTNTSTTVGQALGFLVNADKTGALTYTADEEAALRVKIGLL